MTERETVIEECKAALSAACMSWDFRLVYDQLGCDTCGPERLNGLVMEDITTILDLLKTSRIKP